MSELRLLALKVSRLVPTKPVLPRPTKVATPEFAVAVRVPERPWVEAAPTDATATETEAFEVVTVLP